MLSIVRIQGYPIWHIESPHRYLLAHAFLRMQEFQESPNPRFCGNIFTLDDYMDWYMSGMSNAEDAVLSTTNEPAMNAFARKRAGKNGAFTYGADWSGFNVQARVVRAVYEKFAPHTVWEKALFALLESEHVFENEQFYLIGTLHGASDIFAHELRHGLYGVVPAYRAEVLKVLKRFPVKAFRKRLLVDYGESVVDDEVHAYALTGYGDTYGRVVTAEMRALTKALKKVETKYLPR